MNWTYRMIFSLYVTQTWLVRFGGRGEPSMGSTNSQVAFDLTAKPQLSMAWSSGALLTSRLTGVEIERPEVVQELSVDLSTEHVELRSYHRYRMPIPTNRRRPVYGYPSPLAGYCYSFQTKSPAH